MGLLTRKIVPCATRCRISQSFAGALAAHLPLGAAAIILAADPAFSVDAGASLTAARARDALHATGLQAIKELSARLLALPVIGAGHVARRRGAARTEEAQGREKHRCEPTPYPPRPSSILHVCPMQQLPSHSSAQMLLGSWA